MKIILILKIWGYFFSYIFVLVNQIPFFSNKRVIKFKTKDKLEKNN